jgi:hypothetical protein
MWRGVVLSRSGKLLPLERRAFLCSLAARLGGPRGPCRLGGHTIHISRPAEQVERSSVMDDVWRIEALHKMNLIEERGARAQMQCEFFRQD